MKKKTTEEFINEAKLVHGNKYDYSLVEYNGVDTKVKIICKKCGNIFEQTPYTHKKGSGCPKCAAIERVKRKNIEELKNEFKNIDFSNVKEYKNNGQILQLKCKKCNNLFNRTYKELRKGRECPYCSTPNRKNNLDVFKFKARLIHGDKFDYSLVNLKGSKEKVKIICNICGNIFEQTPNSHFLNGCPCCSGNIKLTTEQFIKKAKLIHGDKYDYSLVDYINAKTKVKIICSKHGVFEQEADSHLSGCGCPICNISKGEERIENILTKNKLEFEHPKRFEDLRDKSLLSYDFYIPSKNLLIEYNGIQHYEWTKAFQPTLHDFHKQLHHDWLKRKYAKENGYKLIVLKEDEELII